MLYEASTTDTLTESQVRDLLARTFAGSEWDNCRLLVIIPDGTRTAPIPQMFRLLYEILGERVAALDYLIALGTHRGMSDEAIAKLVGATAAERAERYPKSQVYNHAWWEPANFFTAGTIPAASIAAMTDGLRNESIDVTINKMILDYDHLLICGPVFPHEVAGFSGGAKYLFPGIAGAEIINKTHWVGALATSMDTIGVQDTAVRRILHEAANLVLSLKPVTLLAQVMHGHDLHGLYIGDVFTAWAAAADLSAQLNIRYCAKPFQTVLSMPDTKYEDLWTAAKAMYKTEPVVADGGEVIIYAPHLKEISYSHGDQIRAVGYHVRDYFTNQWDKFSDMPGGVLAHSTHVRGKGTYDSSGEHPRIDVTLATGISEADCRQINLGYRDPATIDPADYANRENEGILLVENAGEYLYRLTNG
ncbi:MAG: DUF2088 domain-containing protein [Anaerolineales bacterium]|nr:DUF2088 domain-containing protein [Anaerolineales bacterium]